MFAFFNNAVSNIHRKIIKLHEMSIDIVIQHLYKKLLSLLEAWVAFGFFKYHGLARVSL